MKEIIKSTADTPDTSFDKILAHMRDLSKSTPLEKDLQQMFDRWLWADTQLRNGSSATLVVGLLMKRYEISRATGWRDIKNTKKMFGMLDEYDPEYDHALHRDSIQADLKGARQKGDYASVARLQAVWERMRSKAQDSIQPETPQPSVYVIELNVSNGEGKENKVIDITHLQKLSATELKQIDESVDNMELGEADMLKMLNEGEE